MNCPRCRTQLSAVEIEQAEVQVCSTCEGAWYPDEALGSVTDHSFSELKATELSRSMVPDKLALVDLEQRIDCPVCSDKMLRYTYSLACPIELDECPHHGVWLDDGELGTLVSYLTDLNKRVGHQQEKLLNERHLMDVLEILSNVYSREH